MSFLGLTSQELFLYNEWFDHITAALNPMQAMFEFLTETYLPKERLAYIWKTSGINQNGVLLRDRFYIVMRMVALCQQGYDPSPDNVKNIRDVPVPVIRQESELRVASDDDSVWELPAKEYMQYADRFRSVCPEGFIPLNNAAVSFVSSNLPSSSIRKILTLSDFDRDGRLDEPQFVMAMHLINLMRSKKTGIPDHLPKELIASVIRNQSCSPSNALICTSERSDHGSLAMTLTEKFERTRAISWQYSHFAFTDEEALHIAKLLFRHDHNCVSYLEIVDSRLGVDGLAAFAKMMSHNSGLTSLKMDNTVVNNGSYSTVFSSLKVNKSLQSLSLNGCNINDDDIDSIIDLIAVNTTIRDIHLLRNPISSDAAVRLLLHASKASPFSVQIEISDETRLQRIQEHSSLTENSMKEAKTVPMEPSILNSVQSLEPAITQATYPPDSRDIPESILPTIQVAVIPLPSMAPDTALSSFHAYIDNRRAQLDDALKSFSSKLSFSLYDSNVARYSSTEESLRFMYLQVPIRIGNCLTAYLSISSIRKQLKEELDHLSQAVSTIIHELEDACSTNAALGEQFRNIQHELVTGIFSRHRLLDAQYYLHSHLAVFSFYRALNLYLCDLWLACLLCENCLQHKTVEDRQIMVTATTFEAAKQISEAKPARQDWIRTFSEELARRLTFRYEAQIRELESSDAIHLADCALYRIISSLENLPDLPSLKAFVVYILESVANPSIKSRHKSKTVEMKKLKLRWKPESIFLKPALAVISDGSDFDRWVVEDDKFSLWTGKRGIRPSKYGYRLASLSELKQYQSLQTMEQVRSPPVSRWLANNESIQSEKQRHIALGASKTLSRYAEVTLGTPVVATSEVLAPGQTEKPKRNIVKRYFSNALSKPSRSRSASRNAPGKSPDSDIIARLEKKIELERSKRIEAEKKLVVLMDKMKSNIK